MGIQEALELAGEMGLEEEFLQEYNLALDEGMCSMEAALAATEVWLTRGDEL